MTLHAISGANTLQVADPCSTWMKTLSVKLQEVMSFLKWVLCKSDICYMKISFCDQIYLADPLPRVFNMQVYIVMPEMGA